MSGWFTTDGLRHPIRNACRSGVALCMSHPHQHTGRSHLYVVIQKKNNKHRCWEKKHECVNQVLHKKWIIQNQELNFPFRWTPWRFQPQLNVMLGAFLYRQLYHLGTLSDRQCNKVPVPAASCMCNGNLMTEISCYTLEKKNPTTNWILTFWIQIACRAWLHPEPPEHSRTVETDGGEDEASEEPWSESLIKQIA